MNSHFTSILPQYFKHQGLGSSNICRQHFIHDLNLHFLNQTQTSLQGNSTPPGTSPSDACCLTKSCNTELHQTRWTSSIFTGKARMDAVHERLLQQEGAEGPREAPTPGDHQLPGEHQLKHQGHRALPAGLSCFCSMFFTNRDYCPHRPVHLPKLGKHCKYSGK